MLRRLTLSRFDVAVVVAVTNVGRVLPFGLRNLTNFQNSFWLCGCILAKNAFFLCLNFATTTIIFTGVYLPVCILCALSPHDVSQLR